MRKPSFRDGKTTPLQRLLLPRPVGPASLLHRITPLFICIQSAPPPWTAVYSKPCPSRDSCIQYSLPPQDSCIQKPHLSVQLYIINTLSFQGDEASPSPESPVHPRPASLYTSVLSSLLYPVKSCPWRYIGCGLGHFGCPSNSRIWNDARQSRW